MEQKFYSKHYRKITTDNNNNKIVNAKGGVTIAVIKNETNVQWGYARCSDLDNFAKRLGNVKSFGKAMSKKATITEVISKDNIFKIMDNVAKLLLVNKKLDCSDLIFETEIIKAVKEINE